MYIAAFVISDHNFRVFGGRISDYRTQYALRIMRWNTRSVVQEIFSFCGKFAYLKTIWRSENPETKTEVSGFCWGLGHREQKWGLLPVHFYYCFWRYFLRLSLPERSLTTCLEVWNFFASWTNNYGGMNFQFLLKNLGVFEKNFDLVCWLNQRCSMSFRCAFFCWVFSIIRSGVEKVTDWTTRRAGFRQKSLSFLMLFGIWKSFHSNVFSMFFKSIRQIRILVFLMRLSSHPKKRLSIQYLTSRYVWICPMGKCGRRRRLYAVSGLHSDRMKWQKSTWGNLCF